MTNQNKSTSIHLAEKLDLSQPVLLVKDKPFDYSDIADLSDSWVLQAKRAEHVPGKKQVSLRIDEDILEFFKLQGSRYQTRMHAVLRAYVDNSRNQKAR